MIVLDGAPWIGQQLDALAAQRDAPASWEVVVADNGSTDGTQEIVVLRETLFPVPLRLVDASDAAGGQPCPKRRRFGRPCCAAGILRLRRRGSTRRGCAQAEDALADDECVVGTQSER